MEIDSRMSLPTKNNFVKLVNFQDNLVSLYRTTIKGFCNIEATRHLPKYKNLIDTNIRFLFLVVLKN